MKFTRVRLIIAVLVLAMAIPAVAVAVTPFTDVAPGKFYEAPIDWAFNNNITTGKTATTFEPDAGVTRGESVTFLKRYNDNIVKQTVGSLACSTGQIPVFGGTDWACGTDTTIPDTNTDALGSLSCTTDQVAHYDGTDWVCGTTKLVYDLTPAGTSVVASVTGGSGFGTDSSIVIGTDGRPIISHLKNGTSDLVASHCNAPDCSTGAITTTLDNTSFTGEMSAITIGADGFPIISYKDGGTPSSLRVYHCTAVDCSAGASTAALGTSPPLTTSIAIGADGYPIISYGTFDSLKVYHCTAVDCSAGASTAALDPTALAVSDTSIAIGSDGFPIISYHDLTNENLKAYHCTAVDCSAGAAKTLDTGGTGESAGNSTSIAIGANGLPIISYANSVSGSGFLNAYHCTAFDCSTGDTPSTLDTWSGGAGGTATTSIATGADGLPIISYYSSTGEHIKAYRCGTADCSTGATSVTLNNTTGARYADLAIGFDGRPIISYRDHLSNKLMVARVSPTLTVGFG